MLRRLGWLRLLCSSGLQQLGLGNTAGHTTDSGRKPTDVLFMNYSVQHTNTYLYGLDSYFTEPSPQVPTQDGTFLSVWTAGQPLDVWGAFSVRGDSGKCVQVG